MAITPKDLENLTKTKKSEKKLIDDLEKQIDEYLIKNYQGDAVNFYLTEPLSTSVQKEIIKRYGRAQWHVEYVSHQHISELYLKLVPKKNIKCSFCGKTNYKCICQDDGYG